MQPHRLVAVVGAHMWAEGGGAQCQLTLQLARVHPRRLLAGWSGHRLNVQLLAQVLNFVYAGIDLLQSQLRKSVTKCILNIKKMDLWRHTHKIPLLSGSLRTEDEQQAVTFS